MTAGSMKNLLLKIGHLNSVLSITLFSILISDIVTFMVCYPLKKIYPQIDLTLSLILAAVIPLIVAPIASWWPMGLLFKTHRLEQQMRNLAIYDSLTGLLNRRFFLQNANALLNLAKREHKPLCVLAIDVDRFKEINDQYGHAAGDKVLKSFATTIGSVLRKSDLIGRMGGDEFITLLPNTFADSGFKVAEHLHSAIKDAPILYDKISIHYTLSIGLAAAFIAETESIEALLNKADKALYLAKKNGRNQTSVLDATAQESQETALGG
ncbi:MAG: GGDEF domain-containing protein [Candidatus Competibacteraceae bacterium]|nr:GGDEF domain-containing protein [Candidatus Competibacteraceae bacterium]